MNPFHRANQIVALLGIALAIPDPIKRAWALQQVPAYRSRGKGRGTPLRSLRPKPSRYMPHQGEREIARRLRQANHSGGVQLPAYGPALFAVHDA